MERLEIMEALDRTAGEIKAASRLLGVCYRTLCRWIKELEMVDTVHAIKRKHGRPLRGSPLLVGMAPRGPRPRAPAPTDFGELFKDEQEVVLMDFDRWLQSEDIPIECSAR